MVSVAPKHQSPPAGAGPRVGRAPLGAVSAMAGGIRAASEPARQSRRVLSGGPAARPELRVANASSPLLRGLGVDSRGNVYVTATSCHRVLKITPDGQVTSLFEVGTPLVSYGRRGKRRRDLRPRIHPRQWPGDGRLAPTGQETCERQHRDDSGDGSYRSLICFKPLK